MHDALQTESNEQLQNILTELCTSVITEEDCKNQVIQDALNVSCDEEMNNLLAKIVEYWMYVSNETNTDVRMYNLFIR